MTLRVYDTLKGTKEEFKPVTDGKVGIYFCGMTVQDRPHIGHMFAFVAGDMIRRYLKYKGYDVTYIQNFTDIDDKIIAKANEEGVDCKTVADRNIGEYFKFAEVLNILPADVYPKATEHIADIISLINALEEQGLAYQSGNDVFFRVREFSGYGKLSKRKVDELQSGARIDVDEQKEDPLDFTLWKGAKKGEPSWDSPWGKGRPGWHIECSVMSMKYLGETLDMHGGGLDLVFPHHENEIAQSEGATGRPFVNYWIHNGLLNLKGEKMSKSTGHFFSVEEVTADFSGDVVRFYLLSTHFRSNTEFSHERLEEAEAGLERITNLCVYLDEKLSSGGNGSEGTPETESLRELVEEVKRDFEEALDDDFNSGEAIGHLFRLVREANRVRAADPDPLAGDRETLQRILDAIETFDLVLGLYKEGLPKARIEVPEDVQQLIRKREDARKQKDWAKADSLRDEILAHGFTVEDRPEGPLVKRAKG
jgi:cysteinyl-tRNA synthetase